MDQKTSITRALSLPADASQRAIVERINDLRDAAGEDFEKLSDQDQLVAGEHEQARLEEDGTVTVTLYIPIKQPHGDITELTFKRPTVKVMQRVQAMKGDSIEKTLKVVAELTGKAPSELADMDVADMATCNMVFGFLSKPPRRTGTKS